MPEMGGVEESADDSVLIRSTDVPLHLPRWGPMIVERFRLPALPASSIQDASDVFQDS